MKKPKKLESVNVILGIISSLLAIFLVLAKIQLPNMNKPEVSHLNEMIETINDFMELVDTAKSSDYRQKSIRIEDNKKSLGTFYSEGDYKEDLNEMHETLEILVKRLSNRAKSLSKERDATEVVNNKYAVQLKNEIRKEFDICDLNSYKHIIVINDSAVSLMQKVLYYQKDKVDTSEPHFLNLGADKSN